MTVPSDQSPLVVAINPASGKGKALEVGRQAFSILRDQGHLVDSVMAESEVDLSQVLERRLEEPHRGLVVVGGDGVVHTAIQVLTPHPDAPLGIIPAGTGNDVARAIGLNDRNPLSALGPIIQCLSSPPRRIDLGEANHEGQLTRFAAVYSAGFDALVNERANRLRFPTGPSRYTVAMVLELSTLTPRHYRLTIDGVVVETDALLVAVANTESFGGGMRIVPDTPIDDGLLQVFIVSPLPRLQFVRLYPKVFSGRHVGHPAVTIRPARTVRIEVENIVGYADGERVGQLPVEIKVLPGALPILA